MSSSAALDLEDRSLHRPSGIVVRHAGKPAGEQGRGRLGDHDDPVTDLPAEEVHRGRLASPGTACEHDPQRLVDEIHDQATSVASAASCSA